MCLLSFHLCSIKSLIVTNQDSKLAATTVAVAVRPEGSIPVGQVSDRCDGAPHCVGKKEDGWRELQKEGKAGEKTRTKKFPRTPILASERLPGVPAWERGGEEMGGI